jgi:hypothetical protein
MMARSDRLSDGPADIGRLAVVSDRAGLRPATK